MIAQNWQFLRSERSKRDEVMDKQWQDAIKVISKSEALSPALIELQPFLNSTKYGDSVRDVAVNLLSTSRDVPFLTAYSRPRSCQSPGPIWNKVIQIDRALYATANPIGDKLNFSAPTINFSPITQEQHAFYDYVEAAAPVISPNSPACQRRRGPREYQ